MIAEVVTAASGDERAAQALAPALDRLARTQDLAALVTVLRRIIGGENDTSLLNDLNPIDTAIVGEVLARLNLLPGQPDEDQA